MLKIPDLRAHLSAAVPALARDPEKFIVLASGGRVVNTGTLALSFEYAYTVKLFALDYAGHADAIMVPLLAWAKRHQPELFDNPERRANCIRFEVEYLTTETIDLSVELDLTERVIVRPRDGGPPGALQAEHPPEALPVGWSDKAEHWSLWLRDEQIAEWSFDPRLPLPPAPTSPAP